MSADGIISTIGGYLDQGYNLWVSCTACGHRGKVNLERLAETLGRDYDLSGRDNPLREKLQCEACKEVGKVTYSVSLRSDPPPHDSAGRRH
jgi:hypothetical protein